jgi:hypothetical protein
MALSSVKYRQQRRRQRQRRSDKAAHSTALASRVHAELASRTQGVGRRQDTNWFCRGQLVLQFSSGVLGLLLIL